MTQFEDAAFEVETTTAAAGPTPESPQAPPPADTPSEDLDAAEADAGDSPVETEPPAAEPDADAEAKAKAERDAQSGRFKKKESLQQRIDRAVAQQREAERRAAELEAKLKAVAPVPDDDGRPKREDFDDYDTFQEKLVDWRVAQRLEAERRAAETRAAEAREAEIASAYTARVTAFAAATPDFSVAIARAAGVPISSVIQRAVFESEQGPQLAYHLATHPEDALQWTERTKALDVSAAPIVREWLESKILATPASPGPVATSPRPSVPAPIKPVGSAPVVASDGPPPDDAPFEVHKAYYDAIDRKRRSR